MAKNRRKMRLDWLGSLAALAVLWPGSAGASQTAPSRVVSVNMCTDELLLLLARPDQIASVTHLAQDPDEFPFWRSGRRYPANDGSMVSVAGYRPDLILAMGGVARDRARLAKQIGAELVVLPFPRTLADIEAAVQLVAEALGREERGQHIVAVLHRYMAHRPTAAPEVMFLSDSGYSLAEHSLGAEWLTLAGARVPKGQETRVSAETLLLDPPEIVVRSDYRRGQTSRGQYWPGFRFIDRSRDTRIIYTDGRRWTCSGPSLLPEIRRLREILAQ